MPSPSLQTSCSIRADAVIIAVVGVNAARWTDLTNEVPNEDLLDEWLIDRFTDRQSTATRSDLRLLLDYMSATESARMLADNFRVSRDAVARVSIGVCRAAVAAPSCW